MTPEYDNFYPYSRDLLVQGINKVCDLLRPTFGPGGSNVVIEETMRPGHRVTNDGKLIADAVTLANPMENVGANIIKEAGSKAEKESGDGRKTTMILTQAIINEGLGLSITPMMLKRSLDAALPVAIKKIEKASVPVEDVTGVATIASENKEIGKMIGKIYNEIGKEGVIEIDTSGLPETFYEITDGVRLRGAGCITPYSFKGDTDRAVVDDAKILVIKDKISSPVQLDAIFVQMVQKKIGEVVIYCDDIEPTVLSSLAYTHRMGAFKTVVIKSPKLWKDLLFADICAATGATSISSNDGRGFKSFDLKDLGSCKRLIVNKDETRIIGGKDLTDHIQKIKDTPAESNSLRLAWLQTKVAVLKVGAQSESELSYILKKSHDGCSAAYWALQEGIVPGAGLTLMAVGDELPETFGGNVLKKAMKAPHEQIKANLGGDLDTEGVYDPTVIVKNALKNAVSIAGTILTAKGIITLTDQQRMGVPR